MDTQSFCQNLEEIDPLTLPSVLLIDREHLNLPRKQGIYFVIDSENEIHYIGASSDLRQRFVSIANVKRKFAHLKNPRIAYCLMSGNRGGVFNKEAKLIDFYRPSMNLKVYPGSHYSTGESSKKMLSLSRKSWYGLETLADDMGFDSIEDFLEQIGSFNVDKRFLSFLLLPMLEDMEFSNVSNRFLSFSLRAIANHLETL